mmetsp:Transcript_34471/g.84434  ORF Transcript_34471/g.84434 Transcript_34471/m.84434 type:complete len:237 (-) Transcript_34471:387-1097(-)
MCDACPLGARAPRTLTAGSATSTPARTRWATRAAPRASASSGTSPPAAAKRAALLRPSCRFRARCRYSGCHRQFLPRRQPLPRRRRHLLRRRRLHPLPRRLPRYRRRRRLLPLLPRCPPRTSTPSTPIAGAKGATSWANGQASPSPRVRTFATACPPACPSRRRPRTASSTSPRHAPWTDPESPRAGTCTPRRTLPHLRLLCLRLRRRPRLRPHVPHVPRLGPSPTARSRMPSPRA